MQTTTTARTYAIDPAHSEVGFAVRHLMISKVRGHFTGLRGTIELGAQGDIPTRIEALVDVASVDTREAQRDQHLRSADFFDAASYPEMTFASTRVDGSGSDFTVTGDLTIRGKTNSVSLKGEIGGRTTDPWGMDRVAYSATGRVNRKDYGVSFHQALETGGVMVGDDVDIVLEIEAVLQK